MYLSLILPPVQPDRYPALETCPYPGRGGTGGTCFGARAAGDCTCPSGVATTYEIPRKMGQRGRGEQAVRFPYEMATSPDGGTLYGGNFLGNRIQRFGSGGSRVWRSGGTRAARIANSTPRHMLLSASTGRSGSEIRAPAAFRHSPRTASL